MLDSNIEKIWMFFLDSDGEMNYDKFLNYLCSNFTAMRKNRTRYMFDRLDQKQKKKIDLNILTDIFNPRNHFGVKTGRKTLEEIKITFNELISIFIKENKENLVSSGEFLFLFKFLSIHIEKDKNYFSFLNDCFRYNDLRNYDKYS